MLHTLQVHACEWNPAAIAGLRHNLIANHVLSRCTVWEGDCRHVAPKQVADRVILGLLPSSEGGWRTAVQALKSQGPIELLHYLHVRKYLRS